ncbi:MAG: hypothetical protein IGR76_14900 [Synechococcales cyanobacterium T60_A2020_003]|nr:hypothetical protein [Synechococcales cyanobacterium T60_A2020_003]
MTPQKPEKYNQRQVYSRGISPMSKIEGAKATAAGVAGAAAGYGAVAATGVTAAGMVGGGAGFGAAAGPVGAGIGALAGLAAYGIYRVLKV